MKKLFQTIVLIIVTTLFSNAERHLDLNKWTMQSSNVEKSGGDKISQPSFNDNNWYKTEIPTTVLGTLINNNVYNNPRIGMNNYEIPDASNDFNKRLGIKNSIDKEGKNRWQYPHWFRTVFELPENYSNKTIWLTFNGINYRAQVWVNGHLVADSSEMVGMFRRFKFDISRYIQSSKNCIAVKIYLVDHPGTPSPGTQLKVFGPNRGTSKDIFRDETLKMSGGWDCAPVVRDRNMGIYQKVWLEATGDVTINDPFVTTSLPLKKDTTLAYINIKTTLRNNSDSDFNGEIQAKIELQKELKFPSYTKRFNAEMKDIVINIPVSIKAKESKEVSLSPSQFKELQIRNPHLWYPNGYGEQYLHTLTLSVIKGDTIHKVSTSFGIREVKTSLLKNGNDFGRVFYINGKRIFCRGGWLQPDILLNDSETRIYNQARLIAATGINLIGSEDMPSPTDEWLDSWDKYGLMDWHVFHQCYRMFPGRDTEHNPDNKDLAVACVEDMIKRYRNHPCIIAWFGVNEVLMDEELFQKTEAMVSSLDTTRPYIPTTSVSWDVDKLTPYLKPYLPTGTTDDGAPDYNWSPSDYFFDKVEEVHLQMFKNEMGMPSVPTYESLKKFIPNIDNTSTSNPTFPLDSIWAEHGAWDANNFCYRAYDNAIRTFYGDPKSAKDYSEKGQLVSAEGYRAMFEAANHRMWDVTTGLMIWKLNSCWPDVCWQIYDWYLEPTAAYYFTKKALEPVHIQMNANTGKICIINTSAEFLKSLTATTEIIDVNGKSVYKNCDVVKIKADSYVETGSIVPIPDDITSVYFIRLKLEDKNGKLLSENLYWKYSQHQNYYALVNMPEVKLNTEVSVKQEDNEFVCYITISNPTDNIAFFKHMTLKDRGTQNTISPVYWTDNFITVFPHETRKIIARVSKNVTNNVTPEFTINN